MRAIGKQGRHVVALAVRKGQQGALAGRTPLIGSHQYDIPSATIFTGENRHHSSFVSALGPPKNQYLEDSPPAKTVSANPLPRHSRLISVLPCTASWAESNKSLRSNKSYSTRIPPNLDSAKFGTRQMSSEADEVSNHAGPLWETVQEHPIYMSKRRQTVHPDGTPGSAGMCVRKEGRFSVQEMYEPEGTSFGGGPASTNGLKLKSYRTELNDGLESIWTGREDLCAFPGILAGGIVATLIETQGNWTAAIALMDKDKLPAPPLTATSSLNINFFEPLPADEEVTITSVYRLLDPEPNKPYTMRVHVKVNVLVENALPSLEDDEAKDLLLCATGEAVFIKIGPMLDVRAHPVY